MWDIGASGLTCTRLSLECNCSNYTDFAKAIASLQRFCMKGPHLGKKVIDLQLKVKEPTKSTSSVRVESTLGTLGILWQKPRIGKSKLGNYCYLCCYDPCPLRTGGRLQSPPPTFFLGKIFKYFFLAKMQNLHPYCNPLLPTDRVNNESLMEFNVNRQLVYK